MYVRQNNLNQMFLSPEEREQKQSKKEEFRKVLLEQIEENKRRKAQEKRRRDELEAKDNERIRKYFEERGKNQFQKNESRKGEFEVRQKDSLDDFLYSHKKNDRVQVPSVSINQINQVENFPKKPAMNLASIAEGKYDQFAIGTKLKMKENSIPQNNANHQFNARLSHLEK